MLRPQRTYGVALVLAALATGRQVGAQERTTQNSVVVSAPIAEVWQAFTTSAGLVKAWGVAQAEADFRIGGTLRTHYDAAAKIGDANTITHHVLAYEPGRMIALRVDPPENAPDFVKKIAKAGWNVMRFDPVAPDRTRVTVTGMGYREGPEWDKAYDFFDKGNAYVLKNMQKAFGAAEARAQAARALDLLRSFAGGDWIHEDARPDGSAFLTRTRWHKELGDAFVCAEGFIGSEQGMTQHGRFVCGIDPASGGLAFWNFGDRADVARGHVRLLGEGRLALDWTISETGGKTDPRHVEFVVEGPDAYRVVMHKTEADAAGGGKPLLDVRYRRVADAPERFKKLKS